MIRLGSVSNNHFDNSAQSALNVLPFKENVALYVFQQRSR